MMTARRIRKLRSQICTWKVWVSDGAFGFYGVWSPNLWDLATPREGNGKDPIIIYGLTVEDALRRYARKRPWHDISNLGFYKTTNQWAKVAVLPNHGLHRKACDWKLNKPSDVEFWH